MSTKKTLTIFGGTGFVGRAIVRRLASSGWNVRVAMHVNAKGAHDLVAESSGRVELLGADITNDASVRKAVAGADAVVNCVGILFERVYGDFSRIHVDAAKRVAVAARDAGARDLVHLSAIGADPRATSLYAKTKGQGEEAVRAAFPDAVLLRPSVIFGGEDNFFNQFDAMSRFSPVLPVFGSKLFQPVYVGDVAEALARVLGDKKRRGKTFELGGPERLSLKDMLATMLDISGRKRHLVSVPMSIAEVMARVFENLPGAPLLTRDQLILLDHDNLVGEDAATLADLGVLARPLAEILPDYVGPRR